MPQKTNLNISPYYDDFDKNDNFYRVLFKPGHPIQARELTALQSILQNQVESFGSHMFKEGSMVIPGNINYDSEYYSVKINQEHLGIDVTVYADYLVGKRIRGAASDIVAVVDKYLTPEDSDDITDVTLFVKYLSSGTGNNISYFEDGEILITDESFTYGNTTISSGDTVASLIAQNACYRGSSASVGEGVYFIRGTFVQVSSDKLVLDPYSSFPSYRVGLSIYEELVTAKDDPSLYDNAKGFSNYSAPGADRLKIYTKLSKKSLDDYNDKNFVELLRVDNGEIKKLQNKSEYSIIRDYFAKRTYEESGDYSVGKFDIEVKESLNNNLSNGGVFTSSQSTEQGNTPSDDLACVKVSPGKAYVRGYDIESVGTTILDVEKPRDKETVSQSLIPFEFGTLLRVNNVSGSPFIGLNNNYNTVKLYNQRKSSTSSGTGNLIGEARIYSFSLTDAAYVDATTEWDLYLFDVQTYTTIVINTFTDISKSSLIRGESSGATGYTISNSTGNVITLTQTSGSFIPNERLTVSGRTDLNLAISPPTTSITSYGVEDIKSVYQDSTSLSSELKVDFGADTVLQRKLPKGFGIADNISITAAGNVTSPGKNFSDIKVGSIIRYQTSGLSTESYNRVTSVSADGSSMIVSGVPGVSGVCHGPLPSGTVTVPFSIGYPEVKNSGGLYSKLSSDNISSVNLSGSNITINSQLREQTTDVNGRTTLSIPTGITSAFFETFDPERYSVFYADGSIEDLTSDQFTLSSDGTSVTLSGLTPSQSSNVTVNVTLRKNGIRNRKKEYTRSSKIVVNKNISGFSTSLSGLTTSTVYGLRVEDKEISLNTPDVVKVIAIHESYDSNPSTLDSLSFPSGLGLDTNSILGEKIIGRDSNAIGQIVTRSSATSVEFVYLNSNDFIPGETVVFEESNIITTIQTITIGNYQDITNKFNLDKGHKDQYYDYSRIVRKNNQYIPSHQLLVIFDHYTVPSDDNGDVYTVNSYSDERYTNDIPLLGDGTRSSDTLDFRPRVAPISGIATISPFHFDSRSFEVAGTTPTHIVKPEESALVGYDFYLPRIDKVVLDKSGIFSVIKGASSRNPKPPVNVEEAMDIATLEYPAYLFNTDDVKITLVDNRRYTMRDIGKLEDRIENLEVLTSLSLLELNTKTLQITDFDGLDRFKSGFFVDDFKDPSRLDVDLSKSDIDSDNQELMSPLDFYTLKPEISVDPSIDVNTADFSTNLKLLDPNVQKTGDLITLKYEEKGWIEQPLASRVENVNPFNMIEFIGRIQLNPASDNWVRNVYIDGGTRSEIGNWNGTYIETIKISSKPDPYIRSRNVTFVSGGLKPLTRYYPFFDGSSGLEIIPKLIEIAMVSGSFQVGETVRGYHGSTNLFTARIIQPNHKTGTYNSPTTTISLNPYDKAVTLPTSYSASSTVLNIDTESLSDEVIGKYNGYITIGMTLLGETSGAQATITNNRLITDTFGDVGGSFFFKDPLTTPPPSIRFTTGTKTFKLTSSSTNATPLPGSLLISSGETTYRTSGIVDTYKQTRVTVRTPPPPPPPAGGGGGGGKDPLAQTFTVDETGAFLTSIDLFFANKDENEKVFVEIRTVELGTPTDQLVEDYARVALDPSQINTSNDGSVATKVTFPSPIYLQPETEYAVVLLSPYTDQYEAWIARMGEKTVNTSTLPDAESVIVTKQYIGGSLFKSQNGTIWTASQFEDLKFKLYKANFTSRSGTAYFYNPRLDTDHESSEMNNDSIKTLPRKLTVGITTTQILDSILVPGKKVSDTTSSGGPYGFIERVGAAISTISYSISVGSGYSTGTYSNVPLYSITGSGSGAIGLVTFASGTISAASITYGGSGYSIGDRLGITTSSVDKGTGAIIDVTTVDGIDTLYLTNVQGEEFTVGQDLVVYEGSTSVSFANTDITSSTAPNSLYDGRVIEVNQFNHGMHSDNNIVTLANIEPNTIPTSLTAQLGLNDTTISVANTTVFATFEGITTSSGYIKINNEIIYYNSITPGSAPAGTLGIGTRGIDSSIPRIHNIDDKVYGYELNGVSLTRINTEHNMPTDTELKTSVDLDTYYLQIDRTTRSTGDNQLSFIDQNYVGGKNISGSRNVQYNTILPQFNIITPGENTTASAQIRSVSGTSSGGTEVSFNDLGFESVQINEQNSLSSPRLVASEVNETQRLTNLPRNKSFTIGITMSSTDSNLSPVIDTQNSAIVYGRNRVNNPISDYRSNPSVNSIDNDPHSAIYVSRKVTLKQPASSLKVLVSSYRHSSADFRVLYQLFRADSDGVEQSFDLFPGYDNLKDTDGDGYGDKIIKTGNNTGRADAFVPSSRDGEFLEYQFSVDNLEQFNGFRIKIVMSGTNEAFAPRFKDLRVIALA